MQYCTFSSKYEPPLEYQGLTHTIMIWVVINQKWAKWDLGTQGREKRSSLGLCNENECEHLARIYVIVLVVAIASSTKDIFFFFRN